LTDCMAFAINYTIYRFSSFLNLQRVEHKYAEFDYISERNLIIKKLEAKLNMTFKDKDKDLLKNLIGFFKNLDHKSHGGRYHIVVKKFDMIWQEMMGRYINRHFVSMSPDGNAVLFNIAQKRAPIKFNDKSFEDIDSSPHHFSIDIDHVGVDSNTKSLYLFDSKYYSSVDDLNYKQFSYNMIFAHKDKNFTIYSVLLLPGPNHSQLHFQLSPAYAGKWTNGIKIIEQYVNPMEVMKDYLSE